MRNAHQIIAEYGLDAARKLATTKAERNCIDAAAALMDAGACTPADVGYADIGGRCFPHKNQDRSASPARWEGKIGNVTITIESGRYSDGTLIGIPYGSKARIIILSLVTAAVNSSSPEIELGSSLYTWLRRMSASQFGGMTYRLFAEQSRRIAASSTHVTIHGNESFTLSGHAIAAQLQARPHLGSAPLYALKREEIDFPYAVVLDRAYWLATKTQSRPIRLCAIRQLDNNSAAIELYIWLAHRLPQLSTTELIEWTDLHATFGSGYRYLRQFKQPFLRALYLALAVYPDAQVEVCDAGIALSPSESPVPAALSL